MNAVQADRLRELYAMLAGIPNGRFDLRSWRGADSKNSDEKMLHNCGTAACAVGWACAYPPLKEHGLRWSDRDDCPAYGTRLSFGAVKEFFGIRLDTTYWLFDHCEYNEYCRLHNVKVVPRTEVMARIRCLLLDMGYITSARNAELALYELGLG